MNKAKALYTERTGKSIASGDTRAKSEFDVTNQNKRIRQTLNQYVNEGKISLDRGRELLHRANQASASVADKIAKAQGAKYGVADPNKPKTFAKGNYVRVKDYNGAAQASGGKG